MLSKIKESLVKFIHIESSSSIVLGLATALALFLANSSLAADYFFVLEYNILGLSIGHWINDGLMAIFFFLVGLEIKKEIVQGELNTVKKASLPIAAALGGMIVPALIYFTFNQQLPEAKGWGIPMATDIAFALGVLSLFGKRVPLALKVLLLAVAIVDDLGAIIVIALFYTSQLKWIGLLIGVFAIVMVQIMKKIKMTSYFAYAPFALVLWAGILYSGVHATIAGVILGLLTPIHFKDEDKKLLEPAAHLIKILHVPVSFFIMPIFALANAGVEININLLSEVTSTGLFKGIFFGLIFGKPIGIFLFSFLSCKFKLAKIPQDLNWIHIFALGNLAAIGFTMSLFIGKLALTNDLVPVAKLGVLAASGSAILIGALSVYLTLRKRS